jgi:sugar O-acyltransferase (sialic acid O-acetyltransferase NeuD family)
MPLDRSIILVGAFHETVELCQSAGFRVAGIFDRAKTGVFMGCSILGTDEFAQKSARELISHPVLLTPDSPHTRSELATLYASWGYAFQTVISPHAQISPSAKVNCGTMIQAGVNVSSAAKIGQHVRLNTMCNIMHDCIIQDYATVAPNAVLLGCVTVESGAYIGAHATLLPGVRVGEFAVVGAGAVVTHDVAPGTTVVGCPAKVLYKKR